jgi:hypothetical protein
MDSGRRHSLRVGGQLDQLLRVHRSSRCLVIIEVTIDRKALLPPGCNRFSPATQYGIGISILVLSCGAMTANVDMPGSDFPGRRSIVVI